MPPSQVISRRLAQPTLVVARCLTGGLHQAARTLDTARALHLSPGAGRAGGPGAADATDALKKLGLSKDQEEKILKVRSDYDAKFAALRKQLQDLEVQEKAAVEKLLTDAQKAKLKELREPSKDDRAK